jgi:hypothetical protein
MSSTTPGYLVQTEQPLPGGLTLEQYIQQVIVGMTGMVNTTVRPKWQKNPAKELPLPEDNWCAFGITTTGADANAFTEMDEDGEGSKMQRHLELSIDCSFYGANGLSNAGKLRDGFQIAQNRDALTAANMGFKEAGDIVSAPELHGQVWFPRKDLTIVLRREIIKSFDVVSFEGAVGSIKGLKDNNEVENVPWNVSEQ